MTYKPRSYKPFVFPTGRIYGPRAWVCENCGALVIEQWIHNRWHDEQDQR